MDGDGHPHHRQHHVKESLPSEESFVSPQEEYHREDVRHETELRFIGGSAPQNERRWRHVFPKKRNSKDREEDQELSFQKEGVFRRSLRHLRNSLRRTREYRTGDKENPIKADEAAKEMSQIVSQEEGNIVREEGGFRRSLRWLRDSFRKIRPVRKAPEPPLEGRGCWTKKSSSSIYTPYKKFCYPPRSSPTRSIC